MKRWFAAWYERDHHLIGRGHETLPPSKVPDELKAKPYTVCPRCGRIPVMPELRQITAGICWPCFVQTNPQRRIKCPPPVIPTSSPSEEAY